MIQPIFGFFLGLILGSFVKMLADRSLENESFFGRSHCPKCKKTLSWFDLIPLFSFLVLRGKCRFCKFRINKEYPLVELILGLLIGYLFYLNPTFSPILVFQIFFIVVLAAVFITDLKDMLIPDSIILPSTGIALIYLLIFQEFFLTSLAVGLMIAVFFLALIIVTRGRGMGGGDVKLGMFLGLGLGFPNGFLALMMAFFIGAIVAIFLLIFKRKKMGQVIPFGPFLVFASYISLFWGTDILRWYLQFI